MFDKILDAWKNRPTPLQDKAESMVIRGLAVAAAVIFVASFLGSLLATKGCG